MQRVNTIFLAVQTNLLPTNIIDTFTARLLLVYTFTLLLSGTITRWIKPLYIHIYKLQRFTVLLSRLQSFYIHQDTVHCVPTVFMRDIYSWVNSTFRSTAISLPRQHHRVYFGLGSKNTNLMRSENRLVLLYLIQLKKCFACWQAPLRYSFYFKNLFLYQCPLS